METTERGDNSEQYSHYHSSSFSSPSDNLTYSNYKKNFGTLLHSPLKNALFKIFKRKGKSGTLNHTSNMYSLVSFVPPYFSIIKKGKFIHVKKQFNDKLNVKFRNRKLLSTVQKNKAVRKSPNYRRKRRKDANGTNSVNGTGAQNGQNLKPVPVKNLTNGSDSSTVNLEKLAYQEIGEYEEFVTMMEQTFSKDPLRAMLSIAFLMVVLVLAIKLCGMKPTTRHQEIPAEIFEEVHYVGIHDILKRKRPFLPKYLLSWERRLRRKFKRRQKMKKAVEPEHTMAPFLDNSEEEGLLYSGNNDF